MIDRNKSQLDLCIFNVENRDFSSHLNVFSLLKISFHTFDVFILFRCMIKFDEMNNGLSAVNTNDV